MSLDLRLASPHIYKYLGIQFENKGIDLLAHNSSLKN